MSEKLDKLSDQEKKAQDAMDKAMSYVEQGEQRISKAAKKGDMMEVEAGNGLIEFGRKKQAEEKERIQVIAEERKKLLAELLDLNAKKKKTSK
jgi:flagellar biosynthesis component FlhA